MTVKSKIIKLEQKWDNADRWLKRIVSFITGTGVIIGLFMGLFSWGIGQLDGFVNSKLEDVAAQVSELQSNLGRQVENLQSDLKEARLSSDLSDARLELNTLIAHNPTNVLEIEKVARYYFIDLGGDWYMSQIYSDWAREYGGDTEFVTHK